VTHKFEAMDVLKRAVRMGRSGHYDPSGRWHPNGDGVFPVEEGTIEGVSKDGTLVKFLPLPTWYWPWPKATWYSSELIRIVDVVPEGKREPDRG
jgi:hypothetical protein